MSQNQCPFNNLLKPKGPKRFSIIFIAWNALAFLTGIREKYGNVAQYKMLSMTNYLVSHPDEISQVFKDEKKGKYKKTWFHKPFYPFFGNGLFNSFGSDWEQQRKKLQPFFNKSTVSQWFPIIAEEALDHFEYLDQISEINAEDIVKPLMQGIMSRILFGLKHENHDSKQAISAIEAVSERLADHGLKSFVFNGILNKLPTPGNLKYEKALKTIDSSIRHMSESNDPKDSKALMPQFAQFMSPKELRDQIFTLYFAGQDTIVSTLLWVLYFLAKHPEYQERARSEVLEKRSSTTQLNFNELDEFVFLNAAIDESMRLAPAAFMMARDIDQDVQLGEYELKKDSLVMLSMYVTHRHPDLWENPLEYRPERFLERKNRGYSFFPYGGGMRMCIGMHLARIEITTIVALFVSSFEFNLKPGTKVKPITYLTLRPSDINLVIRKIKIKS